MHLCTFKVVQPYNYIDIFYSVNNQFKAVHTFPMRMLK